MLFQDFGARFRSIQYHWGYRVIWNKPTQWFFSEEK